MSTTRTGPLTLALVALLSLPLILAAAARAQGSLSTSANNIQPVGHPEVSRGNRLTIRQAQRSLARRHFNPGPVDGILGPRTEAALKRYQQAERLEVTGRLDQDTLARLNVRDPDPQHVSDVQKALAEAGFEPGPVDGRFGPRTRAALRRYASAPAPRGQGPAYETIERFMRATGQQQSP